MYSYESVFVSPANFQQIFMKVMPLSPERRHTLLQSLITWQMHVNCLGYWMMYVCMYAATLHRLGQAL